MKRDLLTILDLSTAEILTLLERAAALKALHKQGQDPKPLAGKTLALIFEKPSTRTRVSFEAGIAHLGGSSIYLGRNDSQLSRNEPICGHRPGAGPLCGRHYHPHLWAGNRGRNGPLCRHSGD